jgi:hypothetical protein
MNPFEMVVAIIFLVVVGSIINNLIKSRHERIETGDASVREVDDMRDQILTLEERIRVLERIVTDTSSREDLRRQFRDLER